MSREYCIGVDVGSSSVRAGIYNLNGQRVAFSSADITQFHYQDTYVEQSSDEIWEKTSLVIQQAMMSAQLTAKDIQSIGFDATCSLVALDKEGNPISVNRDGTLNEQNIIMWMDHRASKEVDLINSTKDDVLKYVGGEVNIEMEIPKILWLKQYDIERYNRVGRFLDLSDFLVSKATGLDIAGVCSLTCKWNYLAHANRFSQPFLASIGLSDLLEKLPKTILPVATSSGKLSQSIALVLGLDTEVVVGSGLIDAHAGGLALVGAKPDGSLAIISGTSNCHMIVNPDPIFVQGVWGPYYGAMLPKYWLSEGGQSAAGALVDWTIKQNEYWPELQTTAKIQNKHIYQVLNEWVLELEAKEAWPTKSLHILADHHGNRSPRSNPNAKGSSSGLKLERTKDSLARLYLATLQAIAYGTKHIIDEMIQSGHQIKQIMLCGGASKNPIWLREYANVTQSPIYIAIEEDAVTLGSAINGAVASGAFSDIQTACLQMVKFTEPIEPDVTTANFHALKYRVYLEMYDHQMQLERIMQE